MRLRYELDSSEIAKGFVTETDIFAHGDLALRVTGVFDQLESGSVCLLDGRWGSGKTTFVKQWAAELKLRRIPSIYFDAFSSDYIESPFQAIAGAFVTAAIEARRSEEPAYRNFLAKAATVGKILASTTVKAGVKAASLGLLTSSDLEDLGDVRAVIADGLGEVTEEAIKRLLEEQASRKSQFEELRRSLESLPDLLRPEPTDEKSPPLIVFIDELDRCRPDFSLGVLEVLKHFFRADGIHFVLVTNKSHLELSVAHKYGSGQAASEYLEKFFDFAILFGQQRTSYSTSSLSKFISGIIKRLLPASSPDIHDIQEQIRDICIAYDLSLRQIESFAINVAITYLAARHKEFRPTVLVSFLSLIKTLSPEMFRRAKTGSLGWREVDEFLKSVEWKNGEGDHVSNIFRYYLDESIDTNADEWRGFGSSTFSYNIRRTDVVKFLANSVIDRFGSPTQRDRIGCIT